MVYTRIDSFDITFPDCSARDELKVNEKRSHKDGRNSQKGTGEKRLYCGANEVDLNKFFGFTENKDKSSKKFFILKEDLEAYYSAIKNEFNVKSSYKYKNRKELVAIYDDYAEKLKQLSENRLELEFIHTYDSQHRYYIGIDRSKANKKKSDYYKVWDYVRDICLPRVTRLLFLRLEDSNKETSFYIKPFYTKKSLMKGNVACDSHIRGGQAKYRDAIYEKYQSCVVTGVTNPKLLVACHILPYSECNVSDNYAKYKYSVQNGLLMTPTIHKLFDLGYLSFNDKDGKIMFSDYLQNSDRESLHLDASKYINISDPELKICLEWHNRHIYLKTNTQLEFK